MKEIKNFISLFEESQKRKRIMTHEEICYSSKFKFGSFIKNVKKSISFNFQRVNIDLGTTTLFCQIETDGDDIVVELHFFRKKLIFFKYNFPSFMNVNVIENKIKERYLNEDSDISLDAYCIEDSFDNFLMVKKEPVLSVSYFTLNYDFESYIKELRKESKKKKKKEGGWDVDLL